MDDSDNILPDTLISPGPECIRIKAVVVEWDGPYTPIHKFVTVRRLPASATEEEIEREVRAVKADPKYFGTCSRCKRHMPKGNMFSSDYCHGCASSEFNIVY